MNSQKYENILHFNTSWLASLRPWYILDFVLSSGYGLTLVKKSHTLNFYPLCLFLPIRFPIPIPIRLQKVLLKTKSYKLVLVTVVGQFTAKATTSKKAIYFLSFMSCSINKLKSHILFTCDNVLPPLSTALRFHE